MANLASTQQLGRSDYSARASRAVSRFVCIKFGQSLSERKLPVRFLVPGVFLSGTVRAALAVLEAI